MANDIRYLQGNEVADCLEAADGRGHQRREIGLHLGSHRHDLHALLAHVADGLNSLDLQIGLVLNHGLLDELSRVHAGQCLAHTPTLSTLHHFVACGNQEVAHCVRSFREQTICPRLEPSQRALGISRAQTEHVAEPGGDALIEDAETEALVTALASVIRRGLPITEQSAGDVLPNLRSVFARAVVPSERRSRIAALNDLLPRLIATISDSEWREATQMLFGLAPGSRRASLTERQRRASELLGYEAGHFRQRRQKDLLTSVALLVYEDLLRYRSRVKRASESLEPTGDTPQLGPEHLNHEEELISRIWQHVYGLRAELIAHLRLSRDDQVQVAEDHRQAALREEDALKALIAEYTSTYGERLIQHGSAEFSAEAVERLSGWRL